MNLLTMQQTIRRLWDEMAALKARVNSISTPAGQIRFGTAPVVGLLPTHAHQGTSGGGKLDHGLALDGLGDDDHPQYLTPAEHTAIGDAAPHHAAVTLAADAEVLLGLTGQELSLDSQNANLVLAGPAAAPAADPTFRALVAADMPVGMGRLVRADKDADGDFDALTAAAWENVTKSGSGTINWNTVFGVPTNAIAVLVYMSATDATAGSNVFMKAKSTTTLWSFILSPIVANVVVRAQPVVPISADGTSYYEFSEPFDIFYLRVVGWYV